MARQSNPQRYMRRAPPRNRNGNIRSLPTYRITRTIDLGQLAIGVADQGLARFISPTSIPDWTDFSNLYDMYRIARVTYRYVTWRAASPSLTGEAFPTLFTALDVNDTVAPASAQEVLNYSVARIHQFSEGPLRVAEITYTPKLQFQTAAATAVTSADGWARTSITTDVWLGHKEWMRQYNTTTYNNTVVNLYCTVELELKNAK